MTKPNTSETLRQSLGSSSMRVELSLVSCDSILVIRDIRFKAKKSGLLVSASLDCGLIRY